MTTALPHGLWSGKITFAKTQILYLTHVLGCGMGDTELAWGGPRDLEISYLIWVLLPRVGFWARVVRHIALAAAQLERCRYLLYICNNTSSLKLKILK